MKKIASGFFFFIISSGISFAQFDSLYCGKATIYPGQSKGLVTQVLKQCGEVTRREPEMLTRNDGSTVQVDVWHVYIDGQYCRKLVFVGRILDSISDEGSCD